MSVTSPNELELAMERWSALREIRFARGSLRPSREETAALETLQEHLDSLDSAQRMEAVARMQRLTVLCRCGHPAGHHEESGGCFRVVGCATGCECERWDP